MRAFLRTPFPHRLCIIALSLSVIGACTILPLSVDTSATAPELDGFGETTLVPSQGNEAARRLFAQGVAQAYAFNRQEAVRAFKAALAQDPACGICAWGVATQLGPNINNPTRGDMAEAVRYADYAMGHSAGAYNAAMVALDRRWLARWDAAPSSLAGWIGLAGPYDFLPIVNPDVKPVFHHPDYPPDTQPLALASADSPPAFLGAAANDDLVDPQRSTVQLAQRLDSLAVPVRSKLYEGVSHTTLLGAMARPLRFLAPVLEDVVAFVQTAEPRT